MKLKSYAEQQRDSFLVLSLANKKLLKEDAYKAFQAALGQVQALLARGLEKLRLQDAKLAMANLGSSLKKLKPLLEQLRRKKGLEDSGKPSGTSDGVMTPMAHSRRLLDSVRWQPARTLQQASWQSCTASRSPS